MPLVSLLGKDAPERRVGKGAVTRPSAESFLMSYGPPRDRLAAAFVSARLRHTTIRHTRVYAGAAVVSNAPACTCKSGPGLVSSSLRCRVPAAALAQYIAGARPCSSAGQSGGFLNRVSGRSSRPRATRSVSPCRGQQAGTGAFVFLLATFLLRVVAVARSALRAFAPLPRSVLPS